MTYQTVRTLDGILQNKSVVDGGGRQPSSQSSSSPASNKYFEVTTTSDILIHHDGGVSDASFLANGSGSNVSPSKRRGNLFCSTVLPLANTIWVQPIFLCHCPPSSNQRRLLNNATSIFFPLKKIQECWESNLGQLGLEVSKLTIVLCEHC